MASVEIYTRPMCGFCYQAKKLLDKKGVSYAEYNIWAEAGRKDEMLKQDLREIVKDLSKKTSSDQ